MLRELRIACAAVVTTFALASGASALTLSFTDVTSVTSNAQHTGASGVVDLEFSDLNGNVQLDITVLNNTDATSFGAGATESQLTGFGFDALAGLTVLLNDPGDYLDTFLSSAPLSPFGIFDFVFADNNNFVGGNANGALPEGTTDTMSLLLSSSIGDASAVEAAYVSAFADDSNNIDAVLRFQQVNAGAGSDKLLWGTEVPAVPLPAAGWMLIAAVGGLGAMRRRQK